MTIDSSGTSPQSTGPTSTQQPAPAKKRKWIAFGLVGCVLLLIMMGGCFAAVWFGVKAATEDAEAVVGEFLSAAEAGDYERAHGYFSVPLKEVQPLDEFEATVRQNSTLFEVEELSFNSRSRDQAGVRFEGTARLKSGTTIPVSFVLAQENEQWKLLSWNLGG